MSDDEEYTGGRGGKLGGVSEKEFETMVASAMRFLMFSDLTARPILTKDIKLHVETVSKFRGGTAAADDAAATATQPQPQAAVGGGSLPKGLFPHVMREVGVRLREIFGYELVPLVSESATALASAAVPTPAPKKPPNTTTTIARGGGRRAASTSIKSSSITQYVLRNTLPPLRPKQQQEEGGGGDAHEEERGEEAQPQLPQSSKEDAGKRALLTSALALIVLNGGVMKEASMISCLKKVWPCDTNDDTQGDEDDEEGRQQKPDLPVVGLTDQLKEFEAQRYLTKRKCVISNNTNNEQENTPVYELLVGPRSVAEIDRRTILQFVEHVYNEQFPDKDIEAILKTQNDVRTNSQQ